jgi:hypothetical protein
LAEYNWSLLYSRFPAQFFNFWFDAQLSSGEMTGLAITAVKSLIKVLLFMAVTFST